MNHEIENYKKLQAAGERVVRLAAVRDAALGALRDAVNEAPRWKRRAVQVIKRLEKSI